ncbi:uncharacterized protein LOC116737241 isoform X1 [Xiphophorus hellerii]|uniref:uncharacterized protein LOC116737241 isoform X1 n=1 Tax=Xiphophorus hellerii TaxID=8084 RepID=UPI0013B37A69|nr:uncharacterized protein LOC116737241 isoform X1 [Xiphophorus hellerii]
MLVFNELANSLWLVFLSFICFSYDQNLSPWWNRLRNLSQARLILKRYSFFQRVLLLNKQQLDTEPEQLVESILNNTPGGERIMKEFNRSKCLTDETRRKLVNILAADMTEKIGISPCREVKEMYSRGIVSFFPYLIDPFSRKGYEHYYDAASGIGYLAWRIKIIQRSTARDRRTSYGAKCKEALREHGLGGPAVRQETQFVPETVLSEEECKEAIALIKHSADKDTIKKKMKLTFDFRRNTVLYPQQPSNILSVFPRFKDVKGLVEQDFVLMFGEDVPGKFLEQQMTTFKRKIIQQCRKLPTTSDLEELLLATDPPEDATEVDDDMSWDNDLSSILLLQHLIPPSALGRKKPWKMSGYQPEKHLVVFKKTETSIQEHLDAVMSTQPYLLAVGQRKKVDHQFFILDKNVIACRSTSSLGAFDELFKAHYVFAATYNPVLVSSSNN